MDEKQMLQDYQEEIKRCKERKGEIEKEISTLYDEKRTILARLEALSRITEGLLGLLRLHEGHTTDETTRKTD